MSDDPELLPCPFCGVSIDLRKSGEDIGGSRVELFLIAHPAGDCIISNRVTGMFSSSKHAADYWNRRHHTEKNGTLGATCGFPHPIETDVLRALARAADDLLTAETATNLGFLSDHCEIALREIKIAMHMAIGD